MVAVGRCTIICFNQNCTRCVGRGLCRLATIVGKGAIVLEFGARRFKIKLHDVVSTAVDEGSVVSCLRRIIGLVTLEVRHRNPLAIELLTLQIHLFSIIVTVAWINRLSVCAISWRDGKVRAFVAHVDAQRILSLVATGKVEVVNQRCVCGGGRIHVDSHFILTRRIGTLGKIEITITTKLIGVGIG